MVWHKVTDALSSKLAFFPPQVLSCRPACRRACRADVLRCPNMLEPSSRR